MAAAAPSATQTNAYLATLNSQLTALQETAAKLEAETKAVQDKIRAVELATALTSDKFPIEAVDALGQDVLNNMTMMTSEGLFLLAGAERVTQITANSDPKKMLHSHYKGKDDQGRLYFAARVAPVDSHTLDHAKVIAIVQDQIGKANFIEWKSKIVVANSEACVLKQAHWQRLAALLQGKPLEATDKTTYQLI